MKIETILALPILLVVSSGCQNQVAIATEDINGTNLGNAKKAFFATASENFGFDANGDGFRDDLSQDGIINGDDIIGINILMILASDSKEFENNLNIGDEPENEVVTFITALSFQVGRSSDAFVTGDIISEVDNVAENGFFSFVLVEVDIIQDGEGVSAFVSEGEDILEIIELGDTLSANFTGILAGDILADPETFDLDLNGDTINDATSVGNVNFAAEFFALEFHVGVEAIVKESIRQFAEGSGFVKL